MHAEPWDSSGVTDVGDEEGCFAHLAMGLEKVHSMKMEVITMEIIMEVIMEVITMATISMATITMATITMATIIIIMEDAAHARGVTARAGKIATPVVHLARSCVGSVKEGQI